MTIQPPTQKEKPSQSDSIVIQEKIVIQDKPRKSKRVKPGKKEKRDRTEQRYRSLEQDLIARLAGLQAQAQQTCESYLGNLEGEIATLTDFLEGSSEVRTSKDAKAQTLEKWDTILDNIKLKRSKAGRKDLSKIDRAIHAMMESAYE